MPTPLKLCSVIPPILHAAMPVEAVMATAPDDLLYLACKSWIIWRSRYDFPAPADPVKNTFLPCFTAASSTLCCSGERNTRAIERFSGDVGTDEVGI